MKVDRQLLVSIHEEAMRIINNTLINRHESNAIYMSRCWLQASINVLKLDLTIEPVRDIIIEPLDD